MKNLATRDGAVTAVQSGSGEDIVLLHSLLCDRTSFDAVLPVLAARYRVTSINLPGFHGSRTVAANIKSYVDAIAKAIDEFGVGESMTLMGNGFGGTLALALAAAKPTAVSKLVVVDAAAAFPEAGRQAFVSMAALVRDQGMSAIATVAARRVYHDSYIDKHPHVIEERRAVLLGIEPNSFLAACEILASIDLLPELPSIRTPTRRRTGAPRLTGVPPIRTAPVSGVVRPTAIRIVEVLPAPFGPSSAQICPARTANESRSTARRRP